MRHRAPLIGVLVALALTAGYWFALYKPALAEQQAYETQTDELLQQQSQLRTEIARLEDIRDDEERITSVVRRIADYVPIGIAQPDVTRQFQDIADAAGVTITSVTFGEPTVVVGAPETGDPATALASVAVSMVVEGSYFPTVDFFRRMERDMPRAVLTESVNLQEGQRSFPSLATTWGGSLFAIVPAASTVAPDDPSAAPGGAAEDAPGSEEDNPS
ncbi:MAG TPA: hypothetical protein VM324_03810 [Egibacteraceae bacterium]|nr:hypothetical protein [Egibacteraceae bacterium]